MKDFFTVQNLKITYSSPRGTVHAVNNVSLDAFGSEVICILGETGSGKSSMLLSFEHQLPAPAGKIAGGRAYFLGRDLLTLPEEEMRRVRAVQIPMIYQNFAQLFPAGAAIDTVMTDPLITFQGVDKAGAQKRILDTLALLGGHETLEFLDRTPAQLSRGQLQLAMISRALSCRPQMVLGDNIFNSLNPASQIMTIDLIRKMAMEQGTAFLLISQNLAIAARLATRIVVVYAGCLVEDAPADAFFSNPQHPYSLGLLGSYPGARAHRHEPLRNIPGTQPNPLNEISGCPFLERCTFAVGRCKEETPGLQKIDDRHRAACWVDPQTGRMR